MRQIRGLVAVVVLLGGLIVVGTGVVVITIAHRMSVAAAPAADTVLQEPAGTRIAAASEAGGRLALVLQGGGPDRVVVVDLASGKRVGRVALAP